MEPGAVHGVAATHERNRQSEVAPPPPTVAGGTPLEEFEHPDRAVYLLGSEDNGLPPNVVQACHRVVTISSARAASFNVAMAGSIVLHDRLAKRKLAQEPPDG